MKHMKRKGGENTNKCDQCDYSSYEACTLKVHMKMHSKEKSNKCSQWEYASSWASALRTHMKIHSDKRSHKCIQCGYASCHASTLRILLRRRNIKEMQAMLTLGNLFEIFYLFSIIIDMYVGITFLLFIIIIIQRDYICVNLILYFCWNPTPPNHHSHPQRFFVCFQF